MKYCKKCGVLYTTEVCPKCGVIAPQQEERSVLANKKTIRRQWIALIVAVPLSILLILSVVYLIKQISQ